MNTPTLEILVPDFLSAKYQTVVAKYRGLEIQRTNMAHWCGPLEFCRNVIAPTGGGGWWSANTIEQAVAEIDEAVAKSGKPADWTYTYSDIPPAGSDKISLTPAALIQICGQDRGKIMRMAAAIGNPAIQLVEGWPLMSWRVQTAPGCTRFCRLDDSGNIQQAVGYINAPESRRSEFTPNPEELPFSTELIMVG